MATLALSFRAPFQALPSCWFSTAALLLACGGDEPAPGQHTDPVTTHDAATGTDGSSSPRPQHPDSGSAGENHGIPCDVATVLAAHCQSCHGSELAFGAPMSLTRYEDFLREPVVDPAARVAEAVLARVQDDLRPMPPPGYPRLSAEQVGVLEAWLAGPLARSTERCEAPADAGVPATSENTPPADCEDFHDFRAHGQSGPNDTTPFDVSKATQGDLYECFNFKVPWGEEKLHGLYFEPLVDEERVLHHYILYGVDDGSGMQDGSIGCGTASRFRMEGWAPGRKPSIMPDDIGFQMPSGPNAFIQLEVHYNNVAGHTDAVDRSGVRVCTTKKLRKHTAASHWLGTENISVPAGGSSEAHGVCVPSAQATIMRAGPHMHVRGVHMKTIIQRANGSLETLFDQPFQFENQIQYDLDPPVVVGPGDRLYTTCTYEDVDGRGAGFGPNTSDEMCYNFLTAYPAGALVNTGIEGILSSNIGKNRCTSLIPVTPPAP